MSRPANYSGILCSFVTGTDFGVENNLRVESYGVYWYFSVAFINIWKNIDIVYGKDIRALF